ncbi:hypothetical protein TNIN_196921 [Trichonephila inaurata madagascariensis]|uniref:Uncharacterized protein n=1 Tax=Trichonephila inaurata madagascariensis TaxID=2747483 RepID=A0A8X6XHP6_9ARAC|nr:hypothetical protein TNIN_196921 [Trichonephila inaurata madagascariensis]
MSVQSGFPNYLGGPHKNSMHGRNLPTPALREGTLPAQSEVKRLRFVCFIIPVSVCFGWERNDLCFRIGSDRHHNVPNGIFFLTSSGRRYIDPSRADTLHPSPFYIAIGFQLFFSKKITNTTVEMRTSLKKTDNSRGGIIYLFSNCHLLRRS